MQIYTATYPLNGVTPSFNYPQGSITYPFQSQFSVQMPTFVPTAYTKPVSSYRWVFQNPDPLVGMQLRTQFTAFLETIFYQLDTEKFYVLMSNILENPYKTDDQVYTELLSRIGEAKKFIPFLSAMKSVRVLQAQLTDQVEKIMKAQKKPIDGWLDIGATPGRYIRPLAQKFDFTGKVIAIGENEDFSTRFQWGFPFTKPYDELMPLNNYAPISPHIPDNSLDLVTCFIGLHHVPDNNTLNNLIASVHRVLKPGGSFIIREHDVCDENLGKLVDVVHRVFNAATGESTTVEQTEVRNFKSMADWTGIISQYGRFEKTKDAPLIFENDPTKNTMIRYTKTAHTLDDVKASLNLLEDYKRPLMNTFMTAIEWQSVRISEQYARFIKKGNSFYQFPFATHIGQLWSTFFNSWSASRKEGVGIKELLTSDYTMMNLFIVTMTTVEFCIKFITSCVWRICARSDLTGVAVAEFEKTLAKKYGDFINHTPFYMFPFFTEIKELWKVFATQGFSLDIPLNLSLAITNTIELLIKGMISLPISWAYGNAETGNIKILVKDPYGKLPVEGIVGSIKVEKSYNLWQGNFKLLELPRYMPFTDILRNFVIDKTGIEVVQIAGQEKVLIDVLVPNVVTDPIIGLPGCRLHSQKAIPTDGMNRYMHLEVDVAQLTNVIAHLGKQGCRTEYVHDF